jgi:hypothetical protein
MKTNPQKMRATTPISRLVKARKVKGLVMGSADVQIDSKEIVEAIRRDRIVAAR